MADIHDQALEWAQANPKDPRSQDILAKAWASKNPDDPRSAQIMQRLGGGSSTVDKIKSAAGDALDMGKAVAEGAGQGLTLGNVANAGGGVQALADYFGDPTGARALQKQGFNVQRPSSFDQGKQATDDELENSYQNHKGLYRLGYVGGSMPLAGMGRAVSEAAGGGIKGAAALGAAQGGLSNIDTEDPTNQLKKAAAGAVIGAGTQAVLTGAAKGLDLAKKYSGSFARMSPAQADAYLEKPVETEAMAKTLGNVSEDPEAMVGIQDKARDAINNSRRALKMRGLGDAQKLSQALEGKSATINPNDYMGHSDEADALLQEAISKSRTTADPAEAFKQLGAPETPDSLTLEGNQLNKLKQYLQKASNYPRGTVLDPVQQARVASAGRAASSARSAVEQLAPDVVPGLNKDMQESMLLQQSLRQGGKNSPLAFVSTESPDRMATLARAESRGAGGLFDFGNQLGAAKAIAGKNVGSGIDSSMLKAAGRAGLRGVSLFKPAVDEAADFPWLQQLQQPLFNGNNGGSGKQ